MSCPHECMHTISSLLNVVGTPTVVFAKGATVQLLRVKFVPPVTPAPHPTHHHRWFESHLGVAAFWSLRTIKGRLHSNSYTSQLYKD